MRQPAVKLRPFFWSKVAWRPDVIWARVPQGSLTEEQLRALEALFPQAAASPQGKATVRGGDCWSVICLYLHPPAAPWGPHQYCTVLVCSWCVSNSCRLSLVYIYTTMCLCICVYRYSRYTH